MKNMHSIDIGQRCLTFSSQVIQAMRLLPDDQTTRVLSRETIRSATSVGANVIAGGGGHTKKEFIHYMAIARKSSLETNYWLRLINLSYSDYEKDIDHLIGENI